MTYDQYKNLNEEYKKVKIKVCITIKKNISEYNYLKLIYKWKISQVATTTISMGVIPAWVYILC